MTEADRLLAGQWQARYEEFYRTLPDGFSAALGAEILELDMAARSIVVRFSASERMANPMGTVHGGVIAGMADTAAGMLSKALIGHWLAGPTVSLSVNYLRPVALGATVHVRARCQKQGRFLNYTSCEGFLPASPNEVLFTGECVYFSAVDAGQTQNK